jgi:hypothetical protein
MSLRADRPIKKKIIQCEAADVVAEARAAESIGISFQNPVALAMGRFSYAINRARARRMIIDRQEDVTPAVLVAMSKGDGWLREVITGLVSHLHAFAREVWLTEEE